MPCASSMGPKARMNPRPTAGVTDLRRDDDAADMMTHKPNPWK
jgi:hypothetical protein